MEDANRALNKAKIALMSRQDSAFFTTVCFSLKHKWDDTIPTAQTNGLEIRYSPTFFMSLTTEEQVFLLLHETMHVAYLHMERLKDRHPIKWNIAADHVINLMLKDRGYVMPQGGLADDQYAGMSTEEVYKLLPDSKTKPEDLPMQDLQSPPEDTPPETLQAEVQDILVRATLQSKMQGDKPGTVPGDIEIALDKLLNPRLPWNRILQKYVNQMNKSDYSFRRPNRRHFPDHYLPSMYSETLQDLAIAVDTSGSVSDHDFNVFISEVASIFKTMTPSKITLVQFDTQIKSVDSLKSINDLMKVDFTGRGGTRIQPVIDWMQSNKPNLMLIFTDGGFYFHDSMTKPKIPTAWVIHNNEGFEPTFGKAIHYQI